MNNRLDLQTLLESQAKTTGNPQDVFIADNFYVVLAVYKKLFQKYVFLMDDLIQEGVIGLMDAYQNFDPTKNRLFNYLFVVIKHRMIIRVRNEMRYQNKIISNACETDDDEVDLLDLVCAKEEQKNDIDELAVKTALKQAKYKKEISLSLQGYKQREIASICGLKRSTVAMRLKKERETIKTSLNLTKNKD